MPKFSVFDCILAANVLWDFTCAFCILTNTSPFSTVHTHLWKNHTDRNNRAACHLMAYLVLSWGCLRLYGLVMATRGIVVFSYVMEALVFACEAVLFGTMLYEEALAVSCFSLMLAVMHFILFERVYSVCKYVMLCAKSANSFGSSTHGR